MNGTLEHTPGGPRLRFTRRLAHPPGRVWRTITEPGELAAWFPDAIAVEPATLLEFRWGTDVIRLELEPDGDGTRLTFLDTIDELGKAARDGAGWHVCLDRLELHLGGASAPWSTSERWRQVHPSYVDALGPEAATIGPPDGALG